MDELQIQGLLQKLEALKRLYLENDLPLNALKIAGSRVVDAIFPAGDVGIAELVRKADRSLEQANKVARSYLGERISEACGVTHEMGMELHQDHPHHYLLQD